MKRALADKDPQVREFTLIGLKGGLDRQRRDEKFLSGLFPVIVPLLDAGTYDVASPAGVMMAADPVKAAPILESPRYFAVRNPQLREVEAALDHKDVKVPREFLLPLLSQLESLAANESREEPAYAAALILYANNPDDRAESRFWTLIHSPSAFIASTAARGLEILAGINAHDAVWDAYNKKSFARMTKPQQFYFAVELYRDEVDNGGHSQYFYNDDSDLYQIAIEELRTMGGSSRAAILQVLRAPLLRWVPAPTEAGRREADGRVRPAPEHHLQDGRPAPVQLGKGACREPGGAADTLYALKHRSDFASIVSGSPVRQSRH